MGGPSNPAEMFGQPGPDDGVEPGLERAPRRIVAKLGQVPGQDHHGLLDEILTLAVRQAGLAGDAVDQPPARFEKLPPARLILMILQSRQQALSRRKEAVFIGMTWHAL
jgi:hypothetical protein